MSRWKCAILPLLASSVWLLASCASTSPDVCASAPATADRSASAVCAHLEDELRCFVEAADGGSAELACEAAYASAQASLPADVFDARVSCFLAARSCGDLEHCNRACGSGDAGAADGGPDADSGSADAGDSGAGDSGAGDSGLGDSGAGDSGAGDSGAGDSGLGDSGAGDSGVGDSSADAGDASADSGMGL